MKEQIEERIPVDLFGSLQFLLQQVGSKTVEEKENLTEALFAAAEFHGVQRRKSGALYIIHPIQVACFLLHFELDTPCLIAALLHDVIEDTDTNIRTIEDRFGQEVAILTEAVTYHRFFSRKESQDKMYQKSFQDYRVACIKIADACANLMHQSQSVFSPEKHKEHLEEIKAFQLDRLSEIPFIPEQLIETLKRIHTASTEEYNHRIS